MIRVKNNPLFYYNSNFDAMATVCRHAKANTTPHPSYVTNYLGVRVDPAVCPSLLQGRGGEIEPIPVPSNWHADIAEFAAVLRAVELARDTFTMAELGCGWGCWMNNAGTVAKRRGLKVFLMGVEGDQGHIALAKKSLATNGFSPAEVQIFWGIAAATEGVALFPCQEDPGSSYGLEPVFNADAEARARALETGSHNELPMVPLARMIDEASTLDLLHIDIQGGEADLVRDSLELINSRVSYLCIGTHSRQIEGRLFESLIAAGCWHLEIERPARLELYANPKVIVDGIQGWRNTRLVPGV